MAALETCHGASPSSIAICCLAACSWQPSSSQRCSLVP
uniref:Uncharacterized protein n=1 Tax=Arundo donax TaxID=35708 RepID=A0A0A9ANC5_ARUDO